VLAGGSRESTIAARQNRQRRIGMFGEFRAFLVRSNALALAIGVILGGALGTVVSSLVDDIIMPPVGKLLGNVDFSQLAIDLGGGAAIRYGAFINAVIAFIIIALIVWQLGKTFIKEEAPPEMKKCPFCFEPNSLNATKCRACTSAI
jgi:large conductance mechanosensitive channel